MACGAPYRHAGELQGTEGSAHPDPKPVGNGGVERALERQVRERREGKYALQV